MHRHRILHIDDDADVRQIVDLSLRLDPAMTVVGVGSEDELASSAEIQANPLFTALLLDYRIGDVTGIDVAARLRRQIRFVTTPVLFLTGQISERAYLEMLATGALGVLQKPFDPLSLAADFRALLDR
jgi:DNA-binding response OmpR family regulator